MTDARDLKAMREAELLAGGLALGALHEVAGAGPDVEHAAAAALFVAGLLAHLSGPVLWALDRPTCSPRRSPPWAGAASDHLYRGRPIRPASAGGGAAPDGAGRRGGRGRQARPDRLAPAAARRRGLGRHQLRAAPRAPLRRSGAGAPSAAVTRWRIASLPSPPPLAERPETPGLARAGGSTSRARGAEPASWIVESPDATGRVALVADMADRSAAPARRHAAG